VYENVMADEFWDHLRLAGINLVPGFGATQPKVMLVGEAPGATENHRLRPFCGPSGTVLNHLMGKADLFLEDGYVDAGLQGVAPVTANAYVTNVVKYRPPHNRTPTYLEIEHAVDDLRKEWLALGGPRCIVCVGGVAHAALSPYYPTLSVSAAKGNFTKPRNPTTGQINYDADLWIVSQYHPAFGLRGGDGRRRAMTRDWEAMGEQMRELGIL
jgi:uracil-DNA glycosylase family 4